MMVNQNGGGLNVAEMASAYAASGGIDEEDLFATPAPVEATAPVEDPAPEPDAPEIPPQAESTGWQPDASLLEDMPELHRAPVTYHVDDFQEESDDHSLKNVADDEAKDAARKSMDAMERATLNIADMQARHGIKHLMIPNDAGEQPGAYHALLTAAAQDDDYRRGQEKMDEIIAQIIQAHPEYIEWENPEEHGVATTDFHKQAGTDGMLEVPPDATGDPNPPTATVQPTANEDEVKVVIDKRQADQVEWTEDDLNKLRRARTIELDIVEGDTIEFGEIESVSGSAVDQIMEEYANSAGSVTGALPASKYRCTFIGLRYMEVLDLSTSNMINNLDGEWKMWSIAFNHIRNQSIGPWEEWDWYIDPVTKARVEVHAPNKVPEGIPENEVHHMTKFHDFLSKTSYKDLQYILWRILCATAMESEIIHVRCRTELPPDKHECGHFYDWVYQPANLLDIEKVNKTVLDEMETTFNATGSAVLENYLTSPVASNNTIKLNSSGFKIIYGHASAYVYLTELYPFLQVDETMLPSDPTVISSKMLADVIPAVKGILVPRPNGKWGMIYKMDDIYRILRDLNEFDFQALAEVADMILEPYELEFSVRDLRCPKCHNTASLSVENIARLLFIVAQSLSSVQVKLRKT